MSPRRPRFKAPTTWWRPGRQMPRFSTGWSDDAEQSTALMRPFNMTFALAPRRPAPKLPSWAGWRVLVRAVLFSLAVLATVTGDGSVQAAGAWGKQSIPIYTKEN